MQIDSKYVNSFLNIFLYDIRLCHETKNVQDLHDSFAAPQNRWCMLIAGCSMEGKDWMLSLVSGNVKGGRQGVDGKIGRSSISEELAGGRSDFSIAHVSGKRSRAERVSGEEWVEKICSPLLTAGRKLKKLRACEGARERDRSANYLLLHRFARIRACCEPRQGTARPSCVIFHGAIDDNAIRGSGRRCRKEFSLREEIPSRRAGILQ